MAPRLAANGYLPVPIKPGTKRPPMVGWPEFRLDDAGLAEYRQCGTGLLCGGELVGIDIDVLHVKAVAELHRLAMRVLGAGMSRIGQPPKLLVAYTATPFRKRQTGVYAIAGTASKVEVLAAGQQFVCYADHPVTKRPYHWTSGNPLSIRFADLPEVTEEQVASFLAEAETVLAKYGIPEKPDRPNGGEPPPHAPQADADAHRRAYVEAALAEEVKRVATAGRGVRNDALNVAALKVGQFVAGGWLDRHWVERSLEGAAHACGLVRDDGLPACAPPSGARLSATIRAFSAQLHRRRRSDPVRTSAAAAGNVGPEHRLQNSNYAYAVWDRLQDFTVPPADGGASGSAAVKATAGTGDGVVAARERMQQLRRLAASAAGQPTKVSFKGPTYLARTTNGRQTWEKARKIYDPGPNSQTIANQIVVPPSGTVIDFFTEISPMR